MKLTTGEQHALHGFVTFAGTTLAVYYGVSGGNLSKSELVAAVPAVIVLLFHYFKPSLEGTARDVAQHVVSDLTPTPVPPATLVPLTPTHPAIPTTPIVPPEQNLPGEYL